MGKIMNKALLFFGAICFVGLLLGVMWPRKGAQVAPDPTPLATPAGSPAFNCGTRQAPPLSAIAIVLISARRKRYFCATRTLNP